MAMVICQSLMAAISEDKLIEASNLVFSNQIKWLHTAQKLFIVEYNRVISTPLISREMGELQRRLNGRRRLDQVSVITWLVLACNLSFSSDGLDHK